MNFVYFGLRTSGTVSIAKIIDSKYSAYLPRAAAETAHNGFMGVGSFDRNR